VAKISSVHLLADTYAVHEYIGVVHFDLDAGVENAGRTYFLLGSLSGTSPGIPLPGGQATLPLV